MDAFLPWILTFGPKVNDVLSELIVFEAPPRTMAPVPVTDWVNKLLMPVLRNSSVAPTLLSDEPRFNVVLRVRPSTTARRGELLPESFVARLTGLLSVSASRLPSVPVAYSCVEARLPLWMPKVPLYSVPPFKFQAPRVSLSVKLPASRPIKFTVVPLPREKLARSA